jgi:DNA-binding transcriptional LysR family regulator
MELHQVRYALAVSKTLNFTRASEECNVTQPALSRAIQQLEAELGGELFRRERSHTHLTELGRAVLPALQQCFEASLSAKALAEGFRKKGHAPFNFALARTIDLEQLTPVLGEITNAFPEIEINIFRGPPHEVAERMKNGDLELAIAEPLGDQWARFDARKLYQEEFGLLINQTHPLSVREDIQIGDLVEERLLCRPYCALTDLLAQELQKLGLPVPSKHEVPLVEDLAGMVRANLGVGIWPKSRRAGSDLRLAALHGIDVNAWISLYTVFGRKQSLAASTFVRLLRSKDWSTTSSDTDATGESAH